MADEGKESPSISRRTFLRGGGLAAAALTALSLKSDIETENMRPPSNIHIVDFAPEKRVQGLGQSSFPDNEAIIKQLAGDEYKTVPQLLAEFGGDYDPKHPTRFLLEIYDKYPNLAIARGFVNHFEHHGEMVWETTKKVLEAHGRYEKGNITPLQDLIDFSRPEVREDELGNKEYLLQIRSEPIIQALRNTPQDIINFSFQLGEVGVRIVERDYEVGDVDYPTSILEKDENGNDQIYLLDRVSLQAGEDGKIHYVDKNGNDAVPLTREEFDALQAKLVEDATAIVVTSPYQQIIDGYATERVEENLELLFEVKREFPNKLIFAAVGNYEGDLRGIDSTKWPQGLLMCAEWNGFEGKPTNSVYGAHIYVDNHKEGIGGGSSNATPMVAAYAEILMAKGVDKSKVIETILQHCDDVAFEARKYSSEKGQIRVEISQETAKLLNTGRLDEYIRSLD